MIFHDLLDDSEAQAGALRARCHIWLGQPLAAVPRQALAVVFDRDGDETLRLDGDDNLPGRAADAALGDPPLDRLDRILDDVDERLGNQPRVAGERHRTGVKPRLEAD